MKWSLFDVPVKVEQTNDYLFSDTVKSDRMANTNTGTSWATTTYIFCCVH